jgi:ribosomal protein S18 acetylase RimI-like enzyme
MRPGEVTIRAAGPADGAVIATMIAEHGAEEGATMRGRAEDYAAALAAGRIGCLLAERAQEALGLAMFYDTFSSWSGRPGLFLEDLYVRAAARRLGIAQRLLAEVACIAVARGADRLDLVVRDVNRARGFYAGQGLRELAGWQVWRADPPELARLAGER